MADKQVIKVVGLRQSGTNYASWLVRHNYAAEVVSNRGGWKHGLYSPEMDGMGVLVVFKHPQSWLVSAYRHEHNWSWGCFRDFLKSENALVSWNMAAGYWLEMNRQHKNVRILRYEDVLKAPEKWIAKVMRGWVERNNKPFMAQANRIAPGEKVTDKAFRKKYYLQEKWRKQYTGALAEFAHHRIDWTAAGAMGYTKREGMK